jgi:hypothetical protein
MDQGRIRLPEGHLHSVNAATWANDAWGKHPNDVGLTVPAGALHALLARVVELEGLGFAADHNLHVEVSMDGVGQISRFKRSDDLDTSTLYCPCGQSFTWGMYKNFDDLRPWCAEHVSHLNR